MILVLTGPTGSGKSDIALSLAKKLGAAIINADAFQVYQELSIATAKPTKAMMAEAPHYLYDFLPLDAAYNVAEYQADMRSVLHYCLEKNQHVIIAGGTGLYIKAAIYDYEFASMPPVDLSSYEKMEDAELYDFLRSIDPASAEAIHPHNRVRVLRAIAVCLGSGEKKSDIESRQAHRMLYPARFYSLNREREQLYEHVNERVDHMFEQGLLEETVPLIQKYGREVPAFRAIGVKELFPYLDGKATLEETKELIKKNTRNYVKRQLTWFRHQFDATWVEGEEDILSSIEE
ncbi:MAG: tRNA (adenosine(37)-N6)-dimethylallyltransferase MiaA [Bacilli bacterium]|nr:tRNA (adenosine(37)-N6)-dimethylallyltransferase MiaA [Bacilli bacterium]